MLGEFPDVVFDLHWKENYMNYIQVYVYSICEEMQNHGKSGKITIYENNMFYIKGSSKNAFWFETKKLLRCDETEEIGFPVT